MYWFTWTYNTPHIWEFHGKDEGLGFTTPSVAKQFFDRIKRDPAYQNVKAFICQDGVLTEVATL